MAKRFIAVLTALIMVFSIIGVQLISAETTSANDDSALNFLSSLGVAKIDDTDYTQEISREEFSVFLAKALRMDGVADEVRYFRDVESNSYAVGAVNALAQNGIISITEDRKFRPKDAILYEEACKMLVCALGYELIADSRGGYPSGYVVTAAGCDIKPGATGKAITYYDAFDMILDMLKAELPEVKSVDSDGNVIYTVGSDNSILNEYWNIYETEGCLETVYGQSLLGGTVSEKNQVILSGVTYETALDAYSFFGGYVTAYYEKKDNERLNTVLYLEDNSGKEAIEIKPENFVDITSNGITYYNDNDKSVTLSLSAPKFVYNGRPIDTDIKNRLENINKGSIWVKDGDNDGRYDVVIVKDYKNFVVSTVNTGNIYNMLETGDIVTQGEYENERIIASSGAETDYSTISAGTVLSVARSVDSSAIEILISDSVFQGSVEQINSDDVFWYLTVGGTKYKLDKSYGISVFGTEGQKESSLLSSGKQYEFKLDSFGNIAYMNVLGSQMKTGVIIKSILSEEALSSRVKVKLLAETGVIEELTFAEKVKINGEIYDNKAQQIVDRLESSVDKLIRYSADDDGYIKNIQLALYDDTAKYNDDKIRAVYNGINQQWYNTGRLGTAGLLKTTTPIFMIPYNDTDISEDECAVINYSSRLVDNTNYYSNVYHFDTNSVSADAAVIYYNHSDLYDNNEMYRPIIMFSQIVQKADDNGDVVNVLVGYTRGARMEYEVPDSISFDDIEEGDLIMLNHGLNGEIIEDSQNPANNITVVCRISDIERNHKPSWSANTHHDYLYKNSNTAVSGYYRADFQMSFGYVCRVSGTDVAWSYNSGDKFSEAASIPGNIVIYDSSRKNGEKIYLGKATDLITYEAAGYDCSKIIFRTRGGRLWETFSYQ